METFQELRKSGTQARLFLETRNGLQFGTLQIRTQASKPGAETPVKTPRKKAPSTVRRDQQRLRTYLLRKSLQEPLGSPVASSTPASKPGQSSSNQDIDIQVAMPVTPGILDKRNSNSETKPIEKDLDQHTTESDKMKEKCKSNMEINNKDNATTN